MTRQPNLTSMDTASVPATPFDCMTMHRRLKVALISFDFGEYCIRLAGALAEDADVALLLPDHEAAGYLPLLAPTVRFQPFSNYLT